MDVWEDAWVGSVGRQTEHTVGLAPGLFVSGSEVLLVTQLALQAGSHCLRTGHKEWIFIYSFPCSALQVKCERILHQTRTFSETFLLE